MEMVLAFLAANKVALLGFLFALSEFLAVFPNVESNSVFQLVFAFLKKMSGK